MLPIIKIQLFIATIKIDEGHVSATFSFNYWAKHKFSSCLSTEPHVLMCGVMSFAIESSPIVYQCEIAHRILNCVCISLKVGLYINTCWDVFEVSLANDRLCFKHLPSKMLPFMLITPPIIYEKHILSCHIVNNSHA